MHVRLSLCLGFPVVDDDTQAVLGTLSGALLHPDTGKIEGFFIRRKRFMKTEDVFLSTMDIKRWGLRISVRNAEVLGPVDDRVRLQPILEDGRTILGQTILTDTGRRLGVCRDLQFDTAHFMAEWLFPKSLWKWGTALPISSVIEVTREAVIVRDPATPVTEVKEANPGILEKMPEAA